MVHMVLLVPKERVEPMVAKLALERLGVLDDAEHGGGHEQLVQVLVWKMNNGIREY